MKNKHGPHESCTHHHNGVWCSAERGKVKKKHRKELEKYANKKFETTEDGIIGPLATKEILILEELFNTSGQEPPENLNKYQKIKIKILIELSQTNTIETIVIV